MLKIFTDGGSRGNPGQAACGFVVYENDKIVDFSAKYLNVATNNQAEYNGLLLALNSLKNREKLDVECYLDSELVVKQLNGQYKIKNKNIIELHKLIKNVVSSFKSITFIHIPRSKNFFADRLVNIILDNTPK